MNYITEFSIPGLPGWVLEPHERSDGGWQIAYLIDKKTGSGFGIRNTTTVGEICEQMNGFLQHSNATPETMDAALDALTNIDWTEAFKLQVLSPPPVPVINDKPVVVYAPRPDTSALVKDIITQVQRLAAAQ